MIIIAVEISKYLLLFFMLMFTWGVFRALGAKTSKKRKRMLRGQIGWMILFNIVGYSALYLQTFDAVILGMFLCVVLYFILTLAFFHVLYRRASFVLLNVMCMMMSIGFLIQTRFSTENAMKQLVIASAATVISLFIPIIIKKWKGIKNLGFPFAIIGIILIGVVYVFAKTYGGGKLSVEIGGISFQFSEFVKITFVLFIASMLREVTTFKQVMKVTILAGIHVIILVLSTDLGAALIYFMAYIVMVCLATRKLRYAFLGIGGMVVSATVAYKLFSHVRVRVAVWLDPFSDYQGTGYQIAQALFSICAGGWFGTGLMNGSPESVPVVEEDFIFAAICEEMGILFGICLIALCMGLYMVIVNIAMKLNGSFYKLVAIGLGTEYAFQVFLTIGGQTKFIPMTGVTLPLISYGGSSVMCTIFMLAVVQGLYVLRKDEDEMYETEPEETDVKPVKHNGRQVAIDNYTETKAKKDDKTLQSVDNTVQSRVKPSKSDPNKFDTEDMERRIEEETERSLYW